MNIKRKNEKTIAICASASFFREAVEIEAKLTKLGFKVKLPFTAMKMKRNKDFRPETYKTWLADPNPNAYKRKTFLIKNHLKKVVASDAILVINHEKNGIAGYIGGNTLLEMGIAFHLKKPIYILNAIGDNLAFKEEVFAIQPKFINGDLTKLV